MSETRYTEEHEWLCLEDDGTVTVGITDFAQEQLGDVVYVELPRSGEHFDKDKQMAVIESVKAAGEINAPLSGSVLEVNARLAEEPEIVNTDPHGEGWIVKIDPESVDGFSDLMDEEQYRKFLEDL